MLNIMVKKSQSFSKLLCQQRPKTKNTYHGHKVLGAQYKNKTNEREGDSKSKSKIYSRNVLDEIINKKEINQEQKRLYKISKQTLKKLRYNLNEDDEDDNIILKNDVLVNELDTKDFVGLYKNSRNLNNKNEDETHKQTIKELTTTQFDDSNTLAPKTRKQRIEEIISKSKIQKLQNEKDKQMLNTILEELDNSFNEIKEELPTTTKINKANLSQIDDKPVFDFDNCEITNESFDQLFNYLSTKPNLKPSTYTKTKEEIKYLEKLRKQQVDAELNYESENTLEDCITNLEEENVSYYINDSAKKRNYNQFDDSYSTDEETENAQISTEYSDA